MNIKTALVTGGSRGIGKGLSERLLDQGVVVYSVSRSTDQGVSHQNFHPIQLDLSDLSAVQDFLSDFPSKQEIPDLLINNAGYGAFFEWARFPDQDLLDQAQVLFTAPALFCKAFAPAMAERKFGVILNLSSLAVLYPLPYMPIYNAAKSALSSLTHSLMLEYEAFPRLIDFRMGDVRTSFNQSSLKQAVGTQTDKMKVAWDQIEKQLQDSPEPNIAAGQIIAAIFSGKRGTIYGGGFFQGRLAPFFAKLLPQNIISKILKDRYFT